MKFIMVYIQILIMILSSIKSKWIFLKPFEQWGDGINDKFFFSFDNPEEYYIPLQLSSHIKFSWK